MSSKLSIIILITVLKEISNLAAKALNGIVTLKK